MLAFLHDYSADNLGIFTRSFAEEDNQFEQLQETTNQPAASETTIEYIEDEDLVAQMKALGLPVAFGVQEDATPSVDIGSERKRKRNAAAIQNSDVAMSVDYLPKFLASLPDDKSAELWSSWAAKFPQFSSQIDRIAFSELKPGSKLNSVDEDWLLHCAEFSSKMPATSEAEIFNESFDNKSEYISQRLQLLGYRFNETKAQNYSLRLGQKLSKIKKDRTTLDLWRSKANVKPDEEKSSPDYSQAATKYEAQKYRLFSLFDQGIQLDEESWFSVTPEKVAAHHAQRLQSDVAVDAFCGAGGDAIQLAFTCELVIAIDIDPCKIEMARHNAAIYGVADRIEFICGDIFKVAPCLRGVDVFYMSPPWGGPQYANSKRFDLFEMLPIDMKKLFEMARKLTHNIALFVPRNTDVMQLVGLAENSTDRLVEIEQNFYGNRLKAITAYYGDLVDSKSARKAVKLKNSFSAHDQGKNDDNDAFSEYLFAPSGEMPIFNQ